MDQSADQTHANELIDQGNLAREESRLDDAIDLYRQAIELCPAYASFNLVIGDDLQAAGRLEDAAHAYRATVASVPEHDQAWEALANCLYRLGDRRGGDEAMMRFQELEEGLTPGDADEELTRYHTAVDINDRAKIAGRLAYSTDDRVHPVLHQHLVEALADIRGDRIGTGLRYWVSIARLLVRFGLAPFLDRYSDGPAPSQDWLTEDLEKYLAVNSAAPDPQKHQPIFWIRNPNRP